MVKPNITDVTEQKRLNDAREAGIPWKKWGPYLSERQWGTVREDYSDDGNAWDYFTHDQARSRAYRWGEDGLGGHQRRQAATVLRARVVERAGPDPEGTPVRAHQQRGQPRRGREGVLLLHRQHAHALVHEVPLQVPAAGVSVPGLDRDQPAPVPRGVRVRAARHGRLRRGPLLRRVRGVREGGARGRAGEGHRPQPRAGGGPVARAADAVVPEHLVVGRRPSEAVAHRSRAGRRARVTRRSRRVLAVVRRRARVDLHREREQRQPSLGPAQCLALRQGRVPRLRRVGSGRRGEPGEGRDQGRGALRARRAGQGQPDGPPAARRRAGLRTPSRASSRRSRVASRTPTSSTHGLRRTP